MREPPIAKLSKLANGGGGARSPVALVCTVSAAVSPVPRMASATKARSVKPSRSTRPPPTPGKAVDWPICADNSAGPLSATSKTKVR